MSDLLVKIAALLRQAEGTKNEHEAEAFMKKAQVLATNSGIELEIARTLANSELRKPVLEKRHITIGERGKKGLYTYVNLFHEIGRQNNVNITIATNSTYVNAFGFDTDIDVVEALYQSLVVQMVQASDAYIRSGEYKKEIVTKTVRTFDRYWGDYDYKTVTKPLDGRVARANFQDAFASKIGARLHEARLEAEKAAVEKDTHFANEDAVVQQESTLSDSVALVLKRKEEEARSYYKAATASCKGSWKGGSNTSYSSGARQAGTQAGSRARIGASTAIGGSRKALV